MHLVAYISRSRIPEGERDLELRRLIKVATERNAEQGVTGALLLLDDRFIQVLEGEKDSLHALVARIEQDPRHCDLRILLDEELETRSFPQWSMELFVVSPSAREVAENFSNLVTAYTRLVKPQAASLVNLVKSATENPSLAATFRR